jgi:hypothetical protein
MLSQALFSYQEHEINTLEIGLSAERFSGYLTATQGDRFQAIKRYERNTVLSEALYGVVQGFEVVFRNGLSAPLARAFGPEWYRIFEFGSAQRDAVCEAERKILKNGKLITSGRMVSQLTFGFWMALIGPSYEKKLWVPYLHRAFPNAIQRIPLSTGELKAVKIPRHKIAERIESVKTLRNRIAHHDAIVDLATEEEYNRILEAIDWICPTTATWVAQTNCLLERFHRAI